MKQRIYLDTSVLSALHDDRAPERRLQTQEFWNSLSAYEASTSELTRQEIGDTPDAALRARMLESLNALVVFPISAAMQQFAAAYIDAGIFPRTQEADAIHVAAAVLTRHDVLLSWNFKHLVNRRRRALVNATNISLGAATVDIISPLEL